MRMRRRPANRAGGALFESFGQNTRLLVQERAIFRFVNIVTLSIPAIGNEVFVLRLAESIFGSIEFLYRVAHQHELLLARIKRFPLRIEFRLVLARIGEALEFLFELLDFAVPLFEILLSGFKRILVPGKIAFFAVYDTAGFFEPAVFRQQVP